MKSTAISRINIGQTLSCFICASKSLVEVLVFELNAEFLECIIDVPEEMTSSRWSQILGNYLNPDPSLASVRVTPIDLAAFDVIQIAIQFFLKSEKVTTLVTPIPVI